MAAIFLCPDEVFTPSQVRNKVFTNLGFLMRKTELEEKQVKKIPYEIDGKIVKVEVKDDVAAVYEEIDKETKRNEWKHEKRASRHYCSLEQITFNGFQIKNESVDIQADLEQKEIVQSLHKAIKQLLLEQQKLIYLVFFKGETLSSIAAKRKVSKQAVAQQLNRVKIQLKNILKNL